MWKFKWRILSLMLLLFTLSFYSCSDSEEEDDHFLPPTSITEALKQLYPTAQRVEWEPKGVYYVAECYADNKELDVWFDTDANWIMTEVELSGINKLAPLVYAAFEKSDFISWTVAEVSLFTYPEAPAQSVIQVKQGNQRIALSYSQDGDLLSQKVIGNGDDTNWPSPANRV